MEHLLPASAAHQGAAVLAKPLAALDFAAACRRLDKRRNIVLVLDQVEDPQNVGAILRSAAAFRANALILTERHAPPITGAMAKAASGALELVPLCRLPNLALALERLGAMGYWRIGLDANAPLRLADALADARDVAFVLGAEGKGLRRLTEKKCDALARLPVAKSVESLNVAVAAAIALYETRRSAEEDAWL
jgi:23S rRNA (guanosine2251-2'-O)-methyltransferase